MRNGWCLACKYYAFLIADLCAECDPKGHGDNEPETERLINARYEAMYEAAIAKGGDEDVGNGQKD